MLLSAIKNKLDLETMLKFTLPMNFFTGILTVSNNEFDDHAKNTVGISNFKCVINVLTLFGKFSSVFISQVQKFFSETFCILQDFRHLYVQATALALRSGVGVARAWQR